MDKKQQVQKFFKCNNCDKEKALLLALQVHISNYHRETHQENRHLDLEYKKTYQKCGKKFERSYNCKRHTERFHKDQMEAIIQGKKIKQQ